MSIRIYIGNLPQGFNPKEFDSVLKSVSDSIRFKAVLDKETKESRGFGFATTNNEQNANLIIEKLNGFEFKGSKLRVELSEKKDSSSNKKNNLKIKDGPLLGELLHYLSKELAYKRLNSFDEAIYKAEQWIEQNAPKCD